MREFFSKIIPFILFGMGIVALAFGIVLLAYLLFFGAIIGIILYGIAWIKDHYFTKKTPPQTKNKSNKIIDSDDWKEL